MALTSTRDDNRQEMTIAILGIKTNCTIMGLPIIGSIICRGLF